MQLSTVMREKVERLEAAAAQHPQVNCPVRNIFTHGMYIREMTIPAGTIATGAVHKTRHMASINKGRCLLTTDSGVKEIKAPYIFESTPGIKRAMYAIEDTVMSTYHKTQETDLDALCEELTESKHSELIGGTKNKQLAASGRMESLQ